MKNRLFAFRVIVSGIAIYCAFMSSVLGADPPQTPTPTPTHTPTPTPTPPVTPTPTPCCDEENGYSLTGYVECQDDAKAELEKYGEMIVKIKRGSEDVTGKTFYVCYNDGGYTCSNPLLTLTVEGEDPDVCIKSPCDVSGSNFTNEIVPVGWSGAGCESSDKWSFKFAPPAPGQYNVHVTVDDDNSNPCSANDVYPGGAQTRTVSTTIVVIGVEIADEGNNVLTSPHSGELVAVKTRLKAIVTPSSIPGLTYKWTVGGSRIKTYEHDIDEEAKHNTIALSNLTQQEISFFWQTDGTHSVELEVAKGDVKCSKSVNFIVGREADQSQTIYAVDSSTDRNPNGDSDTYAAIASHEMWHGGNNMDNGDIPQGSTLGGPPWGDGSRTFDTSYDGSAFLEWHKAYIDAHFAWRNTFNVGPISATAPAGTLPLPEYLKTNPDQTSTAASRVYGYVRLGEFQDLDQLGRDVVHPWHNLGHVSIASASSEPLMNSLQSPRSKEDIFWRWHTRIDQVREDWESSGTDQASVSNTLPVSGATVSTTPTAIRVTFDKKVSSGAPAANTVQLTADKLTVNGSQATSVSDVGTTTSFMVYEFTGFSAPGAGTVNAVLTGTSSYSGQSWSFTYAP